jgi:hypothetical protein
MEYINRAEVGDKMKLNDFLKYMKPKDIFIGFTMGCMLFLTVHVCCYLYRAKQKIEVETQFIEKEMYYFDMDKACPVDETDNQDGRM